MDNSEKLIEALQTPSLYDHPVDKVDVLETHISWVLLAGEFAYKIKKPVNLGFLDFSTLEKRHHYCLEELRLNQRLAEDIYLAVIPITGSATAPILNGHPPIIEYAVKMHRFKDDRSVKKLLANKDISKNQFIDLARDIASFHKKAQVCANNDSYGNASTILLPIIENFKSLKGIIHNEGEQDRLKKIEQWSIEQHQNLTNTIIERKHNGHIRECHGDMHLGNLFIEDNQIRMFDCLEFDANLRWIDTINDLSFILMDLSANDHATIANHLLNEYLSYSGDYQGLTLLRFYLVYRAMVRCKIAAINYQLSIENSGEETPYKKEYQSYLCRAEQYTKTTIPALCITHGFSASGKSTVAKMIAEKLDAIHLRSDIERKRLFNLAPLDKSKSPLSSGIYSADASHQTYSQLHDLAKYILDIGFNVIVDAAFLEKKYRKQFHDLAEKLNTPFIILDCHAPEDTLTKWINAREMKKDDPSEANLDILKNQLKNHQPLSGVELKYTIDIPTEKAINSSGIIDMITTLTE